MNDWKKDINFYALIELESMRLTAFSSSYTSKTSNPTHFFLSFDIVKCVALMTAGSFFLRFSSIATSCHTFQLQPYSNAQHHVYDWQNTNIRYSFIIFLSVWLKSSNQSHLKKKTAKKQSHNATNDLVEVCADAKR